MGGSHERRALRRVTSLAVRFDGGSKTAEVGQGINVSKDLKDNLQIVIKGLPASESKVLYLRVVKLVEMVLLVTGPLVAYMVTP